MSKNLERIANRRKNQKKRKYYLYILSFLFVVLLIITGFISYQYYFIPSVPAIVASGDSQVIVMIESGMTTRKIAGILKEKGVIHSAYLFRACAMLEKLDSSLKAGEYLMDKSIFELDAVRKLAGGEVCSVRLTIPEGYTVELIAKLLEEKRLGSAEKFKSLAKDYAPYDYMKAVTGQKYRAEGFLFPDTYNVPKINSEEQLLKMMVKQFDKHLTSELRDKITAMGWTIYDSITLASLIEREAKRADDRTTIAGVFINRLKKAMLLQSCATIQYLLSEPKEELTIKDTEIVSLYNTYKRQGLPLGPIANPGMDSITAAVFPATTEYFYFVADKQGKHIFSETYEQHLSAINKVR